MNILTGQNVVIGIAAQQGVKLTKLKVNTECNINFAKTFDISDEPISEGINFQIDAQSDNAETKTTGDTENGRRALPCNV